MAEALRVGVGRAGASIPAGLALVAFGGAGPLHACALAEALGMAAVVVPARAGRRVGRRAAGGARAVRPGALVADAARPRRPGPPPGRRWPARRATPTRAAPNAADRFGGGECHRDVARLPLRRARATSSPSRRSAAFHAEHVRRNGYARPDDPVEVIAVRARAADRRSGRPGADLPRHRSPAADRPRGHRRARLHDLGARRLAGRAAAPPAPTCSCGRRRP